jgi:hypothetical protein
MRSLFGRSRRARALERRRLFIEGYAFPPALRDKLSERYPELSDGQITTVLEGLRAWFVACLHADGRTLGMPSRAVDVAWHEFILVTRDYHAFCEEAFGRYLHHSPAAVMTEPIGGALARTAAVAERYPLPTSPIVLAAGIPFLFAIDSELGIEDGNRWTEADVAAFRSSTSDSIDGSSTFMAGMDGGEDSGAAGCGGASCGGASCGGGGG